MRIDEKVRKNFMYLPIEIVFDKPKYLEEILKKRFS